MMMDIFSSFDPFNSCLNSLSPSMFWAMCIMPPIVIMSSYWINPQTPTWMKNKVLEMMYEQSKRTQGSNLGGMPLILSSLFLTIMLVNLAGMLPYLLSASSHLLFTVSLGLPLWLSLIMSGVTKNSKTVVANLLPGGAPIWLNPALIIIETVSIIVRPITLTVRLAANMSAGHIVLGLIGVYCAASMPSNISSFYLLLMTQVGYTLFEFAICLIQSYIFCLLISLYSDEHPAQ